MKKVRIYLAVQSQITICAIEALLSSLSLARGEIVGSGADLQTCINDMKRLKPELVLADQEVCKTHNTGFCQKLAEENPGIHFLCLQSAPCTCNPSVEMAVQISRTDFTQDRLLEALRHCIQNRGRGEQDGEVCRLLFAVGIEEGEKIQKASGDRISWIEQIFGQNGCRMKKLWIKKGYAFYLAEGKHRWILEQELQNLSDLFAGKNASRLLFCSLPFYPEKETDIFPYLFKTEVERRLFYESEDSAPIDLKAEQNKAFFQHQAETFPIDHFSKIIEKGGFRQAADIMKWYLQKAGERQWDCELLKLNILEAGFRILQYKKPEMTSGEACMIKKKVLGISKFTELQELCQTWNDDILYDGEEGGIDEILQYIHCNYYEDLTLSGVAELFNYNYYYLSSAFLKQAGAGMGAFKRKMVSL